LHYAGEASTLGDYPRHTAFSPDGKFFYACNQHSDNITVFRVNQQSGLLTFTGQYVAMGSPACLVFLS
jgi:6-phosphogluconolactonase (cycloisomerase 2 family)